MSEPGSVVARGRGWGKVYAQNRELRAAIDRGEHVHAVDVGKQRCWNGTRDCAVCRSASATANCGGESRPDADRRSPPRLVPGSFVNDDPETWTRVAGNQGPVEVVADA